MSFKTTKELFEQAHQIATAQDDPYREAIAAGLIELAATLQARTTKIDNALSAIKSKVS